MNDNSEKLKSILNDHKNASNNDLIFGMDHLNNEFELTKKTLIQLTEYLDQLEVSYNKLLNEYNLRTNKK